MRHLFAALLLMVLTATAFGQTTISVCPSGCDQTTITAALVPAVAGDTIELRAATAGGTITHAETVTSSADATITIQGRAGDTIYWTPAANAAYALTISNTANDGWTISNINFDNKAGTADSRGIFVNSTIDNTAISDCAFDSLSIAVYFGGSFANATVTLSDLTVTNPQATATLNTPGLYLHNATNLTVDGFTFDGSGVAGTNWNQVINVRAATPIDLKHINSTLDNAEDGRHISFDDGGADILIENSSFVGGASRLIYFFSNGASATEHYDDVVIRFNYFYGGSDYHVEWENAAIAWIGNANKNIVVHGNDFVGDGTNTLHGPVFAEMVVGGAITNNRIWDMTGSGILLQDARHCIVSGNQIYNSVSGIGISANGGTPYNQYGCIISGNYVIGGGASGAISISNYSAGAALQDSMLSLVGNVYVGVTDVGRWTGPGNATSDMSTLSAWIDTLNTRKDSTKPGEIIAVEIGTVDDPGNLGQYRAFNIIPPRRHFGARGGLE